jgi:hypothetical protein
MRLLMMMMTCFEILYSLGSGWVGKCRWVWSGIPPGSAGQLLALESGVLSVCLMMLAYTCYDTMANDTSFLLP